ncbi:hypothetical protein D9613_005641 [Agrocybe pediades]|uniref:Uncharacterized protein n=1 Tax=Agrocybe pediades TaxID=84607 RepID=A0A8H4QV18_9AGAR|nr:hypothetical protein D9613_005641 [Agrocybe pediades]
MSVRQVVVDDNDPGIQYVGPWFLDTSGSQDTVGNFGPPYLETLHGTKSSASLSYSFTGELCLSFMNLVIYCLEYRKAPVLVYGTNNLRNDSGILDPQWSCFVDGIEIGASAPFQFPENNWLFCSHDQLTDGPHVLSVNATVAKQQTFWIDKIHYVPSTDVSLGNQVILVDRNDPALQFDDAWTVLDVDRKITTQTNSILTFEFVGAWIIENQFFPKAQYHIGASLSWYGMIPANYPKTASKGSYVIDDGPPTMFQLQGLPPDGVTNGYYQEFFQTPKYPAGPHKIVVTYLGDSQSTPLTLDYLLVQKGTPDTAPTTTSISLSSGPSSTGGLPSLSGPPSFLSSRPSSSQTAQSSTLQGLGSTTLDSATTTTTPPPSDPSHTLDGLEPSAFGASATPAAKHSNSSIGIILGGVIGGLVLLVLLLIVLYLWHRRQSRLTKVNMTANPFPYAPGSVNLGSPLIAPGMPQVPDGTQNTYYYHPQGLQHITTAQPMEERKDLKSSRQSTDSASPRYSTLSVARSATIVDEPR